MSPCTRSNSPNRPPWISRSPCPPRRPNPSGPASRCSRCSRPSPERSHCGRSPGRRSRSSSRSSARWWRSRRCSMPSGSGAPDSGGLAPNVPGGSTSSAPRSKCVTSPSVVPRGGGRRHRLPSSSARHRRRGRVGRCRRSSSAAGRRAAAVRVDGNPADADERLAARSGRVARGGSRARRSVWRHRLRRRGPARPGGRASGARAVRPPRCSR